MLVLRQQGQGNLLAKPILELCIRTCARFNLTYDRVQGSIQTGYMTVMMSAM
jgi:hypothetical protein